MAARSPRTSAGLAKVMRSAPGGVERPRIGAPEFALVGIKRLGAEVHQVSPTQTFPKEVDREALRHRLAIPVISSEELLIGVSGLVPVGQERTGEVDTLAIPAL